MLKFSETMRLGLVIAAAKRDMSHADITKKSGLNHQTVHYFLTGDRVIKVDAWERICLALNFTPKQVLELGGL